MINLMNPWFLALISASSLVFIPCYVSVSCSSVNKMSMQ